MTSPVTFHELHAGSAARNEDSAGSGSSNVRRRRRSRLGARGLITLMLSLTMAAGLYLLPAAFVWAGFMVMIGGAGAISLVVAGAGERMAEGLVKR